MVQTQTRGSLPGPGGSPSLRSRPLGVRVTPEKTKGESHRGFSHSRGPCVLPLPCPGVQNPKLSPSVLRRPRNSHCPPLSSLTPGAAGCLVGPCGLEELGSYKWECHREPGHQYSRPAGGPGLWGTVVARQGHLLQSLNSECICAEPGGPSIRVCDLRQRRPLAQGSGKQCWKAQGSTDQSRIKSAAPGKGQAGSWGFMPSKSQLERVRC